MSQQTLVDNREFDCYKRYTSYLSLLEGSIVFSDLGTSSNLVGSTYAEMAELVNALA
jgi:hypothetical protein